MDTVDTLGDTRSPAAQRPLCGLTVLVIEDSRYASEAVRLMSLRLGAKIRRADSLAAANRHLACYQPSVAIIDVGLPDGSGLDLLRHLRSGAHRIPVLLGTSGDEAMQKPVMDAGADGFIAKPIARLATFQNAILDHMPNTRQTSAEDVTADQLLRPDHIAYHDDLYTIAPLLDQTTGTETVDYITQFLGGVARSARDRDMIAAVTELRQIRAKGGNPEGRIATLSMLVQSRLAAVGPI